MSIFSIKASSAKKIGLVFGLLAAATANASIVSTSVETNVEIRAGSVVDATDSDSGAAFASASAAGNITGAAVHSTLSLSPLGAEAAVLNFDIGYHGSQNGYQGPAYMGTSLTGNKSFINYFAATDTNLFVDWSFDYLGPNPFGLQIITIGGTPTPAPILGNYGIVGHHEGNANYTLLAGNFYNLGVYFSPNVSSPGGGLTGIEGTLTGSLSFKFGKTSVPESSGLALFGLGLVGLGLARRRKAA
ncbi:PEP-CTERM sorting domain-containing protein [Cellvibrio sp.]|uniref:PEP-CTERM sorting domain-containing protein n=1 Tax=Cellvibrio sp. TaxID=1965322 RepID=UPI00396473C0